jgi:hypothetical protein
MKQSPYTPGGRVALRELICELIDSANRHPDPERVVRATLLNGDTARGRVTMARFGNAVGLVGDFEGALRETIIGMHPEWTPISTLISDSNCADVKEATRLATNAWRFLIGRKRQFTATEIDALRDQWKEITELLRNVDELVAAEDAPIRWNHPPEDVTEAIAMARVEDADTDGSVRSC